MAVMKEPRQQQGGTGSNAPLSQSCLAPNAAAAPRAATLSKMDASANSDSRFVCDACGSVAPLESRLAPSTSATRCPTMGGTASSSVSCDRRVSSSVVTGERDSATRASAGQRHSVRRVPSSSPMIAQRSTQHVLASRHPLLRAVAQTAIACRWSATRRDAACRPGCRQ
eukprot:6212555-Pleurochrysis_carterae.AAC.2